MPGANPSAALAATRDELDRLHKRVPEAVFSCPRRTSDRPLIPSPLIGGWAPATGSPAKFAASAAAKRIGARTWHKRIDPAPPLHDDAIPGGTRTLDLQAISPAKAFCVARLRAEPLELPSRGIEPRLKGLLIHRALELLLEPGAEGEFESRLDAALTTAFRDLIPPGGSVWDAQVGAERIRIEQLLTQFSTIEASRDPFQTVAVEQRTAIGFDAYRLRCRIDRIDRIDRLADGGEILIDYKTGRSIGAKWFDERLSECQLPIYAQAVPQVAGIAAIRLMGNAVEYRGAGRTGLSLPGKVQTFDDRDWESQLVRWRDQLKTLLEEFAAGDVRVRTDAEQHVDSHELEHTGGAFAPLTRVGDSQ
jgi:exodeoxyribonuclease-5